MLYHTIFISIFLTFGIQGILYDPQVLNIPADVTKRLGLFLYRYGGNKPLKILMSNGISVDVKRTDWPHSEKVDFELQEGSSLQLRIHGDQDAVKSFYLASGWIWSSDSAQALEEGADFFYFASNQFNYIPKNQYIRLYDQDQRPQYHFSAPRNWINDPNGMVYHNGYYHLCYQYDPFSLRVSGLLFWGHAVSKDGINWKHLPANLYPNSTKLDDQFTVGGIFSGGGIVKDDVFYFYYTDHYQTKDVQIETQYVAKSSDGIVFGENVLIIQDGPPGVSNNFRDPTVSLNQKTGKYYMLIGTAFEGTPSVVQYVSELPSGPWVFQSIVYMGQYLDATTIECPNKFYAYDREQKQNKVVLLFSINDYKLKDSYTLYVVGTEDQYGIFQNTTEVRRLDYGGDFYATQVFPQNQNDQDAIAITWMQNWDRPPQYLGNDHFSCVMSMTRRMFLVNDKVHQLPLDAFVTLRQFKVVDENQITNNFSQSIPQTSEILGFFQTFSDWSLNFQFVDSITKTIKIQYSSETMKYSLVVQEQDTVLTYQSDSLTNSNSELGDIKIYLDRGALEVFANDGEITFSQRFLVNSKFDDILMQYDQGSSAHQWSIEVWGLGKFY